MARSHQNQLVPKDFLGLGIGSAAASKDLGNNNKLLGPFCLQIPDGEVSLAKLQQMSEQTGFQLASAFSAPRYNGFHVASINAKCNVPPAAAAAAAAAASARAAGYLNGGYRAGGSGYFPTEEQREAALQLLRASAARDEQQRVMSRARLASDADVQTLSREECRKYFKDNRGMRWPVWSKPDESLRHKNGASPHFQLVQAQEALNLWNAANHVPSRTPAPAPVPVPASAPASAPAPFSASAAAAATTLSLGQPGIQDSKSDTSSSRQTRPQQQQPPQSSSSAQLTIFYAGTVNVFDNVPSDRAKAVMLLAGSLTPGTKSWASGPENAAALRALLTATGSRVPPASSAAGSPSHQSLQAPQSSSQTPSSSASGVQQQQQQQQICNAVSLKALPQARKASLARFLERRKERCVVKSSADTSASGNADEQPSCKEQSSDRQQQAQAADAAADRADSDTKEREGAQVTSSSSLKLETAQTQEDVSTG